MPARKQPLHLFHSAVLQAGAGVDFQLNLMDLLLLIESALREELLKPGPAPHVCLSVARRYVPKLHSYLFKTNILSLFPTPWISCRDF